MAGAALLWNVLPYGALATDPAPATAPPPDPAPCVAAAASGDDDKIVALCGALIDNEKTAPADRIKALVARGGAYQRKDMIDPAIGDYTAVLRLDPTLVDIYDARGALWVSGEDSGIVRMDAQGVRSFGREQGLGDTVVYRFAEDAAGALYVAHGRGIDGCPAGPTTRARSQSSNWSNASMPEPSD